MHRFFVPIYQIERPRICIKGEDVKHIRDVLRLALGNLIVVGDGEGAEFIASIDSVSSSEVVATIIKEEKKEEVLPRVSLFQGFAKGAKMDLIVRQATELGVSEIIPVFTERSIVHLKEDDCKKRLMRWEKIAVEASKQSQRSYLPKILAARNWQDAVELLRSYDLVVVPWEEERGQSLKSVLREHPKKCERVALVIGPEGGLTEEEVSELKKLGALAVSLGRNILRTETAAVAALSMIVYEFSGK